MSDDSETFLAVQESDKNGFSVVFEDNGKVAYAYLLNPKREIVADVWIYNRHETPTTPEWLSGQTMPFANPLEFVRQDLRLQPVTESSQIHVEWEHDPNDQPRAMIFLHGKLCAVLVPGAKPGKSLLAAKDGPLAGVLYS